MRVIVTGGNGKLGRAAVARLEADGHEVIVFDRVGGRDGRTVPIDLTDYGQVVDGMLGMDGRHDGVDALVHLAAVPAPGITPDAATFHNNMPTTYNVLQAARRAGIRRIVTASSETVLGLPFETPPPFIPIDETVTSPESTYSLVKHLEERMAEQFCRWDPELAITALRFSNVMEPADYAEFPSFQDDPMLRKWNLWGYIDARDGAAAIAAALARPAGFAVCVVAADDTVMRRPSAELADLAFPEVRLTHPLEGRESLLSTATARRLLDWAPQHSWLDHVDG